MRKTQIIRRECKEHGDTLVWWSAGNFPPDCDPTIAGFPDSECNPVVIDRVYVAKEPYDELVTFIEALAHRTHGLSSLDEVEKLCQYVADQYRM